VLEVNLSLGYPRRAPQCRMLTSRFPSQLRRRPWSAFDFWAASEGSTDLIHSHRRMITYQE